MEMYIEQGADRRDCEMKIAEKYRRPFHILSEKKIRMGGFLGFFSRPGIEVEFYFSPMVKNPVWPGYHTGAPVSWQYPQEQILRNNAPDFEEEKKKVLAAAGKGSEYTTAKETSQVILESLKEIKEKLNTGGQKEEHPAFIRSVELLRLNDFSEKYIDKMLERLRKELPLESLNDPDTVQDRLLEWIGESVGIYAHDERERKSRTMVLVGPTGVGKTTTIAKLAAIFGIGNSEKPAIAVRMITIDAFRIGARAQIESLGNIMQIPVSYIDNKTDLKKEIALHTEETDLFLVDTIGKSPKDSAKLGEMRELLDGCGKGAQVHLVLSASTKTSDIEDILRQFEPFNYRSVILTKMDETNHIGNVISALAEKGKSVSYITDGQKIPYDIKRATVVRFLINLDDFKVDREKIEKRFPVGEADQFKWS
ncbi:MAG: flagellar biosynthesis protein FlhF [Treponema sp.]|jgi:flagellar biosynthesis protein FlhF|nr:flagellar biosynthesis protein FlhF [Treponema sp.]